MTQNSNDLADSDPEGSVLIVGDSGTHKTHLLGSIPGIYIYDFDRGQAINRGRGVPFDTFKDAPYGSKATNKDQGIYEWGTAWSKFLDQLNKQGEQIDKGTFPYRALGLDSMTLLANICLNYVMRSNGRKPADGMRIQDWGDQTRLLETVVDQLTAWPVMLFVTAHIQRDTNQMMETVEYLPLVTGKFAAKLPVYFDEVYYTKTKKVDVPAMADYNGVQFQLITQSQGMWKQAKSRYGVPDGTRMTWESLGPHLVGPRWREWDQPKVPAGA